MNKLLCLLLLLTLTAPAFAQNSGTVPNHAVPIGKGPGVSGFGSVGPCAANVPLVGGGPSADPTCGPIQCAVDGAQYTTLPAAISACLGKTITVSTNITLSTSVNQNVDSTNITCINGATITFTNAGQIISSANKTGITNCTLVGPGIGVPSLVGSQILLLSGDHNFFANNIVTNFGNSAGNGIVEAAGGSTGEIINNVIYSIFDYGLALINISTTSDMQGWNVSNNYVENGILVFTYGAGTTIKNTAIANNEMVAGLGTSQMYCLTVQQSNGAPNPKNISVTGNTCALAANGTHGGYSIAWVDVCTISGNTFNAQGFTYGIDAFEIVGVNICTVTGNVANSGTGGPGFECNTCLNTTFVGNTQNGFASGSYGFRIGTGDVFAGDDQNSIIVSSNVVNFSGGGAGAGIEIHSTSSGSIGMIYTVTGNQINSDGAGSSIGIAINQFSPSQLKYVLLNANNIIGPVTGIILNAVITQLCLMPGINTAVVRVTLNGNTSNCFGSVWTAYTPTVTCSQSTGTAVCTGLGYFQNIDNTTCFRVTASVSGTFTAGTITAIGLPVTGTATARQTIFGADYGVNAHLWQLEVLAGGTTGIPFDYLGANTILTGNSLLFQGCMERS